jgi:hypothetical protein
MSSKGKLVGKENHQKTGRKLIKKTVVLDRATKRIENDQFLLPETKSCIYFINRKRAKRRRSSSSRQKTSTRKTKRSISPDPRQRNAHRK